MVEAVCRRYYATFFLCRTELRKHSLLTDRGCFTTFGQRTERKDGKVRNHVTHFTPLASLGYVLTPTFRGKLFVAVPYDSQAVPQDAHAESTSNQAAEPEAVTAHDGHSDGGCGLPVPIQRPRVDVSNQGASPVPGSDRAARSTVQDVRSGEPQVHAVGRISTNDIHVEMDVPCDNPHRMLPVAPSKTNKINCT
eukprot:gb/GFBE01000318.1/.p1 GENE.gb/GFBE01000318.1/~~gb/GFBE01000318.1/.p1  ORF type:complete len:194 (+),score=16.82 gb/GFBE01000318.1/:1-582(+)